MNISKYFYRESFVKGINLKPASINVFHKGAPHHIKWVRAKRLRLAEKDNSKIIRRKKMSDGKQTQKSNIGCFIILLIMFGIIQLIILFV